MIGTTTAELLLPFLRARHGQDMFGAQIQYGHRRLPLFIHEENKQNIASKQVLSKSMVPSLVTKYHSDHPL